MLTKFQDVSIGNILVSDDTTHLTGALRQMERKGFIIDLDHAKRATDSSGRRTKTGTLIFMASNTILAIGMASLKKDLISFFFVLPWAATITPGRQLDSKSKLPVELWNEGSFLTIAQWKNWDLKEQKLNRIIINCLDPKFWNDMLFVTLLECINDQLESKTTPFTICEKITLSEEQKSEIRQKEEDDQGEPSYLKIMRFFDEYLGQEGESDYGAKELEKINDRAEGKVDRAIGTAARAAKAERRKGIGGNTRYIYEAVLFI